jgi:outer membrane protein assembly factor BamB
MRRLSGHWIAIVASAVMVMGAAGPAGAASSSSPSPGDLPPLADVPPFRVNTTASAIQPGPGPTGTPELAWKAPIGDMHTIPILVDGLLIAGTNDGRLVALDARTGEIRWDEAVGSG